MDIRYGFIRETYFLEHKDFVNMLDVGKSKKQSQRTHLCICVEDDKNQFFIPLRNNLGDDVRKFGRIGHTIPSKNRSCAGLDYRYALIVNDDTQIEWQNERKIPRAQYRAIEGEFENIRTEFQIYLNGYKKAAKKRRVDREPLYRVSSLRNFHKELRILG